MDYSTENLKITTSSYYNSYLPDGRNSYMPVVFADEYFVDLYIAPSRFMISNYGRIYSKSRKLLIPINKWYCDGNPYYSLIPDGQKYAFRFRICDLVANTFVPNPNPSILTIVNHIDTNLNNNYYLNLQWIKPNYTPIPNYTYDRSEAVKCICPNEPSIVDYEQLRYFTAAAMKGKFVIQFVDEVFKPVFDHPNYKISNYGRVYTEYKHNILTPEIDKDGYLTQILDSSLKRIHRLVAFAFYDPSTPHYGDQVNHIDSNKRNNHISNLEWCTCKQNIQHAIRTGLRNLNGERSHFSRHSDAQVEKECQLLSQGYSAKEISEILKIPWSKYYSDHITKIRRKEVCTHISNKYDFPRYSHKGYETMVRSNASLKNRDFEEK